MQFITGVETYYIDEVMSLSLDEFAFRPAVSGAFEAERLSPTATRVLCAPCRPY